MRAEGLGRARLAVALCAWAVLAYEIGLTRVFSVLFRSPYVFLILSIAICGLGIGAAFAAWRPARGKPPAPLVAPAVALAVLLPLPLVLLLTVLKTWIAEANGVGVALLTLLPYTAAGVLLARCFRRYADEAGRLYFFDLAGAALAAASTGALLSRAGGLAVPFVLGLVVALATVYIAWPAGARARLAAAGAVLCCGGLATAQLGGKAFGLPPVTSHEDDRVKPLFQELADPAAGAQIRYTEWSALARTDVVSNTGTDTLYIWTDGDVPTQMEPFAGDLEQVAEFRRFVGFGPYATQPNPGKVLCIGPGGGLDVLLAILGGAQSIEAVELNSAMTRVTERFRGFYGDLYGRPEVAPGLLIDEGRSYLSRSNSTYDVIYFALAKSATSQQGGIALVDNYLYTVEAFEQYLDHLAPGGLLALVMQDETIVDRCLATAVQVLLERRRPATEIAMSVAIVALADGSIQTPYRRLLLVRNGPFDVAALERLARFGQSAGLMPIYFPSQVAPPPYDVLAQPDLSVAKLLDAFGQQSKYIQRVHRGGPFVRLDLSPVTDDRPFYADLSPGLHPFLTTVLRLGLLAGLVAVLAALAAVVVPRARAGGGTVLGEPLAFVVYFAGLGAAYLMVEVALIQKLALMLGYPTLALSVILFSLLLGSALGGAAANRGEAASAAGRVLPVILLLGGALLVLSAGVLGRLTEAVLPLALPARAATAVLVVLPLGFLMGQPFPSGLRLLAAGLPGRVPIAWAVNGVLSVTGSVVAAALSSEAGYHSVLAAGAVIYVVTGLVGGWWANRLQNAGSAGDESMMSEGAIDGVLDPAG